jgi:CDGSH-type Zn-finger protein
MDPSDLVTVTPYRDGPYVIRGPFRMFDQAGNEIPVHRTAIALCRCGRSRMRPFCDGTHRTFSFRAPSDPEAWPPTDACRQADGSTGLSQTARRPDAPVPSGNTTPEASPPPDETGADEASEHSDDPRALLAVLTRVHQARAQLEHALTPPLAAGAYTKLALAEPLLQAADRLLESIVAGTLSHERAASHGHNPVGTHDLDACRAVVQAALRSMPASPPEDRRVAHLRSLLEHATEALA